MSTTHSQTLPEHTAPEIEPDAPFDETTLRVRPHTRVAVQVVDRHGRVVATFLKVGPTPADEVCARVMGPLLREQQQPRKAPAKQPGEPAKPHKKKTPTKKKSGKKKSATKPESKPEPESKQEADAHRPAANGVSAADLQPPPPPPDED